MGCRFESRPQETVLWQAKTPGLLPGKYAFGKEGPEATFGPGSSGRQGEWIRLPAPCSDLPGQKLRTNSAAFRPFVDLKKYLPGLSATNASPFRLLSYSLW